MLDTSELRMTFTVLTQKFRKLCPVRYVVGVKNILASIVLTHRGSMAVSKNFMTHVS
jgi:hypothetical protein